MVEGGAMEGAVGRSHKGTRQMLGRQRERGPEKMLESESGEDRRCGDGQRVKGLAQKRRCRAGSLTRQRDGDVPHLLGAVARGATGRDSNPTSWPGTGPAVTGSPEHWRPAKGRRRRRYRPWS